MNIPEAKSTTPSETRNKFIAHPQPINYERWADYDLRT